MNSKESELPCLENRGLPVAIFLVARELRTALDRRMAPYGLTLQQASLLIRCVHHRGASLQQLTPHLGTDNAGVSRLVDRLEAAGFVERTRGSDRRALALQATQAGMTLAPQLEEVLSGVHRQLLTGLSGAEVATTHDLLRRILGNAKALNDVDQEPTGESVCPTA